MKFKRVTLIFDSQFCGRQELPVKIPESKGDEYIKSLFPELLGVEFDENCHYIVGELEG